MVKIDEFLSDSAGSYYRQGKAKGKAEGRLEALRESALCVARMHVPDLSAELAAHIESATDAQQLLGLISRLADASDERTVRNAIEILRDATRAERMLELQREFAEAMLGSYRTVALRAARMRVSDLPAELAARIESMTDIERLGELIEALAAPQDKPVSLATIEKLAARPD